MFDQLETLNRFARGYLHTLAADLADDELTSLSESTGKTPHWILGHLRIAAEFGIRMLGEQPGCGEDWFAAFGPGSTPGATTPEFTVSDVVTAIDTAYDRLLGLCREADPEVLAEPHGFKPLEPALMSKQDMMSHLLTTHFTYHVAQLSACRRGKGLGPLF